MPRAYSAVMKDFSPHLFWDTDPSTINLEQHQVWLTKRVLEKGLWSDWRILLKLLGTDNVRNAVTNIRSLEGRAMSFACAVLNLESTQLRCSTQKSSRTTHWHF